MTDRNSGATMALKRVRIESAETILRSAQEFLIPLWIRHRNIVAPFEIFVDNQDVCYTMELIDGQPIVDYFDVAGESEIRAATIQLCRAVGAIHAAGFAHRDLKPSNILVSSTGRVVIIDFGLSSALGGSGGLSRCNGWEGTPAYMAPEQLYRREFSGIETDTYSVGVVLAECATRAIVSREKVYRADSGYEARACATVLRTTLLELREWSGKLMCSDPAGRPSLKHLCERMLFRQRDIEGSGAGNDACSCSELQTWAEVTQALPS